MKVLGISADEQRAFWLVLGAIYHLGAAGATKGKFAHQMFATKLQRLFEWVVLTIMYIPVLNMQ